MNDIIPLSFAGLGGVVLGAVSNVAQDAALTDPSGFGQYGLAGFFIIYLITVNKRDREEHAEYREKSWAIIEELKETMQNGFDKMGDSLDKNRSVLERMLTILQERR